MSRFRVWVCIALLFGGLCSTLLLGQVSDEEKRKRELFLKAREEMHTVPSGTPAESPTPRPKPSAVVPKVRKAPPTEAVETPEPTRKPTRPPPARAAERSATPAPERELPPTERPVATAPAARPARPLPTVERPVAPPPATPHPCPTPAPTEEAAPVVIEKSGYEKESGFSLIPFHFFAKHYHYLSKSIRSEIDRAPVKKRRWQFIIVHNSGTRQGNARAFDYYHRNVRRMVNGLAYHFVIGNGTSSGNGQIEIGDRWRRQLNGGHVHSDYLNSIAIGICLVGDFNRDQPTQQQLDSCEELIRYLRLRCGKIDRHFAVVRPHKEFNPPQWPTDCPGDDFPYPWFRRFVE